MTTTIRPAREHDLNDIFRIYACARQIMKDNGNPTQWGDTWPPDEMIYDDIAHQLNYVVEDETGVHGVFAFIMGDDPTYHVIEDGTWPNDEPYGTVHRIASDGQIHGIFANAIEFCKQRCNNLRIDTHADNTIMQHVIQKAGFERCGIIYHTDGTPRIAYAYTRPTSTR